MESQVNIKLLGSIAKAVSFLTKEHRPTRQAFQLFKSQFKLFADAVKRASNDEMELFQTGSSFDDLHLCRFLYGLDQKRSIFPDTDFDFMMVYLKFTVDDVMDPNGKVDETLLKTKLKESESAFLMIPSDHVGYVKLLVTDRGYKLLHEKDTPLTSYITEDGFLPNNVFRRDYESDPETEVIYSRTPFTRYVASGPALSFLGKASEGFTYDFVHTFPGHQWPKIATRWFTRPRDAKWPNERIVEEIKKAEREKDRRLASHKHFKEEIASITSFMEFAKYNCYKLIITTRHHFLSRPPIPTWCHAIVSRRISTALNENQRTCFCIVKLMMSSQKIISSYMVKNMMFWFCEQMYGEGEWEDGHLGERIQQLFDYICTALENHNIPHYFLPPNNLIAHKTKAEVILALDEIKKIKEMPFQTMLQICRKLRVFEVEKDKIGLDTMNEVQAALTLFSSLVQTTCELGLLNFDVPSFANRCFQIVVAMNSAAKPMIRQCSNLFAATSIPELVKPFAVQFMQSGEIDKALAMYQLMLETDPQLVKTKYPETITNIACLLAYKVGTVTDKSEKEILKSKADKNFRLALTVINDSQTLHFAYGNFLKDSKLLQRAVEQFKMAIEMEKTRDDDEALVEITLPGRSKSGPSAVYVPGNVVAYFSVVDTLMDIGDTYEARMFARKFETYASQLSLNNRKSSLELCAHAFTRSGLKVKGTLVLASSRSYKDKY